MPIPFPFCLSSFFFLVFFLFSSFFFSPTHFLKWQSLNSNFLSWVLCSVNCWVFGWLANELRIIWFYITEERECVTMCVTIGITRSKAHRSRHCSSNTNFQDYVVFFPPVFSSSLILLEGKGCEYWWAGAAPGCLLRGGGGGKMSRYCCVRHNILRQPWKSRSAGRGGGGGGGGGGGSDTIFFISTSKMFP